MGKVSPSAQPARPDLAGIFDEQFGYVWSTLRRLGVREADIEDLSHEVFLRVHARLADYDPARPIRPWLFGFAYRLASDYRRLARHRMELNGVHVEAEDPAQPVDERMAVAERRKLVRSALDAMDLERRAMLVLHYVDGVPVGEIAEALAIPLNTAYSRLRLAREELAAAVETIAAREVHRA
ncbi:MAG: RNA polymerase sigma factor [Polyangiaceae bacterium]